MSDYEKINAKVKAQMSARRIEASKRIALVVLKVLVALSAICGLKVIAFISGAFAIILAAVAVCVGTFKIGYIWRDIKF